MSLLGFNIRLSPPAAILETDFRELGLRIRSFREPLQNSVRQVVAPRFRQNFDEGGPGWAPLAQATLENKARYGYPNDILVRTGTLRQVAGQLNLWSFSQTEAVIEALPRAEYGAYHQTGTSHMPQREWATIQDSDIDQIEEVFGQWLDEKIAQSGF